MVLGSVRQGRMGERVARMVGEKIYCNEQQINFFFLQHGKQGLDPIFFTL